MRRLDRGRVNVRFESSRKSSGGLHGSVFTQFFLKQSWEQKKLSLPCSLHFGHCRVSASFGQSRPAQCRFGGLCTSAMSKVVLRRCDTSLFHRERKMETWDSTEYEMLKSAMDWKLAGIGRVKSFAAPPCPDLTRRDTIDDA